MELLKLQETETKADPPVTEFFLEGNWNWWKFTLKAWLISSLLSYEFFPTLFNVGNAAIIASDI